MLYDLERELNSIAISFAPGISRILGATYPSKQTSTYGASWAIKISFCLPNSITFSKNSIVATAPVGLFG
jgi:hypothetical protein